MEITTNTIAELYIKQGYPEKAKDIYKAILELDPGNAAAVEKMRLLDGGGAAASTITPEVAAPVTPNESEPKSTQTMGADAGVLDTSIDAQVARLEGWLANVQAVRSNV